ncbi:hypothetical protein [Lentzea sp. CA-135723]|uniref:hypothetical protein n=1 Tax=Lentzea sp. CA-135723 TaxID=3239950 RepID=UPI003D92256E
MSVRYFALRSEETNHCPVAVVRLSPDGTEEAFTRSLEWGPSDLVARRSGEPAFFEISAADAEQLVVDIIVKVRSERYEVPFDQGLTIYAWFWRRADALDLDQACELIRTDTNVSEAFGRDGGWERTYVSHDYYYPMLRWGSPRSPVRVAISPAEAERLMSRGLAWPPRWFVLPPDGQRPQRVAREHADGTTEVLTDELRWEPFVWHGQRRFVEAKRAMGVYAETAESVRSSQVESSGYHYSLTFEEFVHTQDLLLGRDLLRCRDGLRELEEEWMGGEWGVGLHRREMIREHNWYAVELPITRAEADEYVRSHEEWSRLRRRVYGRLGN